MLEEKKRAKIFDKKYGKWKPKKLKFNSFKNIIFSIFYLPFFVVSFLLFTFARWVHKEGYRYSLGLIILSFSGLLLRIYNIKLQKLWIDELISLSAINNIINSGIPSLPSGVMYTRNIFFHYLLAFIKILFNTEDIKLKIISVIAGFLTIIFVYIFTKKILNKKVAIISSLLITFFNFEIAWSRQIRAYMLLQFAIILCVFVYSRLKKNVSLKNLLLFLFSAIFTVSVSLIGIIIVCILILDFFIEKKNRTKLLHLIKKNTKLFILIFFIFSLFMYAGNIFSAIIFISHSILNPINNTHNYIKLFNSFFPYLYVLMPFLLLTLIFSFNKFIKTIYFYIILILSLTFFIIEASWLRYLTCALPFLIIISSFFIHILYIIYCQKKNKFINILFFIFFLTPFFISDLSLFPQNNYQIQEPQTNFKLSYEYIYKNIKSSDTVISITTGNIPAHYYLKEKFILNKNYIFTLLLDKQKKAYRSYKKNGIWKENYVGTTIITNEMELKKIIKYNSGYLVFDQQKLYHIDNSIKNLLTTMNFLEEYSDETIRLYYWDSESHSFSL
ncbi:glycosyltransferase family 39 protein [Candidatus Parcubacteria bacterium]|nr:glycosyltransferase family 39 protein [Candidatus Parcubacteria bacterium]